MQQVIQSRGQESVGPGTPLADTGAVITDLVDRLCGATGDDEIRVTSQLLILFASLKAVRINATSRLARISWSKIMPSLIEASDEPGPPSAAVHTANLWAALFRQCPREMSHAYLSAGMTLHPIPQEESAWRRFIRMVSQVLGTSVDQIVNEQIPDLP